MSIIIHFNPATFIPSAASVSPKTPCFAKTPAKLNMVPGIEHELDATVMTEDDNSLDVASSDEGQQDDLIRENSISSHGYRYCCAPHHQDHNYSAPPPRSPTPPPYLPPSPIHATVELEEELNPPDVSASVTIDDTQEGSVTRCVCGYEHDDEYMICCDRCLVWQHVDCMGLDRNKIPETYLCEKCEPRKVDRHKAKVLQAKKKVAMPDTTDSEDESAKASELRPKTRKSSRRRKEEDKGHDKSEQGSSRRSRKNNKERMEIKRSKLRRTKNKDSTSTADEDAQDAWECTREWCEKHYEDATSNQYTPEVQLLAQSLHVQGNEKRFTDLLKLRHCRAVDADGKEKKLVSVVDIARDQPLVEYKGKFLLSSQFHELHPLFNKKLYPFVLFHALHKEDICIDASIYGNDARFVRRSCKPNAEIRHFLMEGNLHVYIASTKVIFKGDEVTIPFDYYQKEGISGVHCACGYDDCIFRPKKKNGATEACSERRKRRRRYTSSADDDSSHSMVGHNTSPMKSKSSPVKNSSAHQNTVPVSTPVAENDTKPSSDHETEEQALERRKKMTREERKLDAIMRAFDQMEKTAKRRRQALDRLAQQKAHQPKAEEPCEKLAPTTPTSEEKPAVVVSIAETAVEDEKPPTATVQQKPKKGKRRRGSGTPVRRRTRTNSGGSDILSADDTLVLAEAQPQPVASTTEGAVPMVMSPTPSVTPILMAPCIPSPVAVGQSSPPPLPATVPPVLKTKRSLLKEWLQEKSEAIEKASPLSIHTEMTWNMSIATPTCYVRCTKDNPNAGELAAHLCRRNARKRREDSKPETPVEVKPPVIPPAPPLPAPQPAALVEGKVATTGPGSAKKRWLRQALNDGSTEDELGITESMSSDAAPASPSHNDCLSPNCQVDTNSPGPASEDIVTPLKKRRLMRESVESMPSPQSPCRITMPLEWTKGANGPTSDETESHIKSEMGELIENCESNIKCSPPSEDSENAVITKPENGVVKVNGLRINLSKIFEECKDLKVQDTLSCTLNSTRNLLETVSAFNHSEKETVEVKLEPVEAETENSLNKDSDDSQMVDRPEKTDASPEKTVTILDPGETVICADIQSEAPNDAEPSLQTAENETSDSDAQMVLLEGENSDDKQSEAAHQDSEPTMTVDSPQSCSCSSSAVACVDTLMTSPDSVQPPIENSSNADDEAESNVMDINTEIATECSENKAEEAVAATKLASEDDSMNSHSSDVDTSSMSDTSLHNVSNSSSLSVSPSESPKKSSDSNDASVTAAKPASEAETTTAVTATKTPSTLPAATTIAIKPTKVPATSCGVPTQKRKVSLSEYRMRMKEGANKNRPTVAAKNNGLPAATALPEKLPENVSLAPLPLFENGVQSDTSFKNKLKKDSPVKEENDVEQPRENVTERLKREFGVCVDSEGKPVIALQPKQQLKGVPMSPKNAPPPPPPPPPPRTMRPSLPVSTIGHPFAYPMAPAYHGAPYVINQVPAAQYVPPQAAIGMPAMPHPLVVPAPTPPPPHAVHQPVHRPYSPSIPTAAPLRAVQPHDYATPVNAQSYPALVGQPAPTPATTYPPHLYQSGTYK